MGSGNVDDGHGREHVVRTASCTPGRRRPARRLPTSTASPGPVCRRESCYPLPLGSPRSACGTSLEAHRPTSSPVLTYVNIHSNAFPPARSAVRSCASPPAATGSSTAAKPATTATTLGRGDCCSALCTFELAGSSVRRRHALFPDGECDGAGECVGRAAQRMPRRAQVDHPSQGRRRRHQGQADLEVAQGRRPTQAEFADPTEHDELHALRLLRLTAALVPSAVVPPSYRVERRSAPRATSTRTDRRRRRHPEVILKGGDQGKSKALVKGKGIGLPDPTPAPCRCRSGSAGQQDNGDLLRGRLRPRDVIKNNPSQFKAKAQ